MEILPIKSIRDEDTPLVGADIVNLARLCHLGFPVEEGVVVVPPEFRLKTVLKHYDLKNRELFEQSLTIIKKEVRNIPIPEELFSELKKKGLNPKKTWLDLLEIWLNEIRSKIWRDGLSQGINWELTAQTIFFSKKIFLSGMAFYDPAETKVKITLSQGKISEELEDLIIKLVKQANRKLLLPQCYYFVLSSKNPESLKVIKVTPYTPVDSQPEKVEYNPPGDIAQVAPKKSAIKIFLDLSEGYVINREVDGVFLKAESLKDFDHKALKLVEASLAYPNSEVIYKLSDLIDQRGGVRGTLRLIHQDNLLKEDTGAFLFARNKKNLLNISLAIPFVRSVQELLELKRDLSAKGVARKGSLKFWLELCIPENIINLEEYLGAGVDGIILNLDELSSWLGGFDLVNSEMSFYSKQIKALLKFLEPIFSKLHSSLVPFIVLGNLSLNDEVLTFLVKKGVYGLVVNLANSYSLKEHLNFVEKRFIKSLG